MCRMSLSGDYNSRLSHQKTVPEMTVFGRTQASSNELVSVLVGRYSAAQHIAGGRRAEGLRRIGVEAFLKAVADHRARERPGILGRILLSRAIQRELFAAGYDAVFVRSLMAAALAALTHPDS